MPLNPNGKIDKPALPFPDTAQAASADSRNAAAASASDATKCTPTEEAVRVIWSNILPNAPSPIPLDESFFDLGGHSILATRLIFEIRKVFVVAAPLGLVFDQPTIGGLAAEIDALRNADMGFAAAGGVSESGSGGDKKPTTVDYGQDYIELLPRLKESYTALPDGYTTRPITVFLTGATGFLGAFVLHDLLSRHDRIKKVICLVRAGDVDKGTGRLREGSADRGVWDEEWIRAGRLEVVIGDLGEELFGLGKETWGRIAEEADTVLHNGALVCVLFFLFCCASLFGIKTGSIRSIGYIHTKNFEPRTS